jgi:sec-independent protein translocase protein TatC
MEVNETIAVEPEIENQSPESSLKEAGEEVKPFSEHLEELRSSIIKSLVAVGVSCGICLYFVDRLITFLKHPLLSMAENSAAAEAMSRQVLRSLHPADVFLESVKIALVMGFILAGPVVFYELWEFAAPGLKPKERKTILPIFIAGLFFFLIGCAFCYFVMLPICLKFFFNYTTKFGVEPDWTFSNYISFVSILMLAFGGAFEMPVISALLARFGLITGALLARIRKFAYLGIIIFAALATPSPDVVSQLLLGIPMLGLYELSVMTARVLNKEK